ncbi:MAG TPA: dTMP kinase [Spirochaetia bacterium]|nr:dTMP kinase [Spirochaetia bacterium]
MSDERETVDRLLGQERDARDWFLHLENPSKRSALLAFLSFAGGIEPEKARVAPYAEKELADTGATGLHDVEISVERLRQFVLSWSRIAHDQGAREPEVARWLGERRGTDFFARLERMVEKKRGTFIVFEGLDGAGTSTQIKKLHRYLSDAGVDVEDTQEPTSGPFGSLARQILTGRVEVDSYSLALAFAADRHDHLYNRTDGLEWSLQDGRTVLSDRYVLSSLAYQASVGLDVDWIVGINKGVIEPDYTIFIDTDVDVCMDRIVRRNAHYELFHEKQRLERVRDRYRRFLQDPELTGTVISVDGNGSEDSIFQEIRNRLPAARSS